MSARVYVHPAVFRTMAATERLSLALEERGISAVVFDHPMRPTSKTRLHELVRPVDGQPDPLAGAPEYTVPVKGAYQRFDGEYMQGAAA